MVSTETQRVAWFGWAAVTQTSSFPDVGPYAVNTLWMRDEDDMWDWYVELKFGKLVVGYSYTH